MSGPGSSGGGDGRGPEIPQIECSRISERTVLNSPVPDVVSILKNGDILEIEVQNRTSLVAITKEGNIAGALTLPLLPRIVECMKRDLNTSLSWSASQVVNAVCTSNRGVRFNACRWRQLP
jgi:hypothetical protein